MTPDEQLADDLRQHVRRLASEPRPAGSAAHLRAREYVADHLARAGFAVEHAPFRADGLPPGVNLLTRPLPERPDLPLLLVAAHYDSAPGTPGADDNASAVAALLELAAWARPLLDGAGPRARLQLAAYDQEEDGLAGSRAHSGEVAGPLLGMLSLEMLGYADARPGSQRLPPHLTGLYPDTADFIGVVGSQASRGLVQAVAGAMKGAEGLKVEALAVPGNGEQLPESRQSDHASFWDRGLPALMVTDTSFFRNPHYHRPSDTPDTLDYAFLARVTAGLRLAVRQLVR